MSTLKERLGELAKSRDRGWKAELARHCKVKPPSVSDWVSGRTLTLEGHHILSVAGFFNVRPLWMATGKGKKQIADGDWPFSGELLSVLGKLEGTELLRTENMLRAMFGLTLLTAPEANLACA